MIRLGDDHPLFLRTPLRTHILVSASGNEEILPCSLTHLSPSGCVITLQGDFTPEQFAEPFTFEADLEDGLRLDGCRARHIDVLNEWGLTIEIEFGPTDSENRRCIQTFLDQCRREEERIWHQRHWRQRRRSLWRRVKHGAVVAAALLILLVIGSHLSPGTAIGEARELVGRRDANGIPILIAPEEINWAPGTDFSSYLAENLNNMTPEQRQAYFDRLASENEQFQETATDALRRRLLEMVTYEDAKYVSDRMTHEQRESLRKKFVQSRKAVEKQSK